MHKDFIPLGMIMVEPIFSDCQRALPCRYWSTFLAVTQKFRMFAAVKVEVEGAQK